jgi:excisionase family DNA binding protein
MFFTVRQVADRLAVAPATIYLLCSQQRIDHIRVGVGRGAIRISAEAVNRFIERATVQPESMAGARLRTTAATGPNVFKELDQDRLLEAWRQRGELVDPPDERSAPSSASSCGPSTPPES